VTNFKGLGPAYVVGFYQGMGAYVEMFRDTGKGVPFFDPIRLVLSQNSSRQ
jgi:hypothetical protein